jgi:hypothetical protein
MKHVRTGHLFGVDLGEFGHLALVDLMHKFILMVGSAYGLHIQPGQLQHIFNYIHLLQYHQMDQQLVILYGECRWNSPLFQPALFQQLLDQLLAHKKHYNCN